MKFESVRVVVMFLFYAFLHAIGAYPGEISHKLWQDKTKSMWKYMKRAVAIGRMEIPDLGHDFVWVGGWDNRVVLVFPFNSEKRKEVATKMKQAGWYLTDWDEKLKPDVDSNVKDQYNHKKYDWGVQVDWDGDRDGATCHKVKIGSVKKEVEEPIYEIVCPDAEEENVFGTA